MNWIEYCVELPPETDTESVLYLLAEIGFENSWVDNPIEVVRISDGYDYKVKDTNVFVTTYEAIAEGAAIGERAGKSMDVLREHLRSFEIIAVRWKEPELQHTDDWKEYFQPEVISDELVLIPVWRQEEAQGKYPQRYRMIFEPGGAFGTGKHATTQSCLRYIEQLDIQGKSVLDIGAGSGILSVYCAMRGAASVLAADINPSSPSEIQHLSSLNGIHTIEVYEGDGNRLEGENMYDLIVINIGGEEAVRQVQTCRRLIKGTGAAIVSGIVEWVEPQVRIAYEQAGFTLRSRQMDDEWFTLLFTVEKSAGNP